MYLPSFFTGFLLGRLGLRRVMLMGVLLLAARCGVTLLGGRLLHYWTALVLLGLGWNFLFLGGTTLLTRAYRPEERFQSAVELQQALRTFVHGGLYLPTQTFTPGSLIVREGERGDAAFMIVSGTCRAYCTVNGQQETLTTMHAGDVFGEMALLLDLAGPDQLGMIFDSGHAWALHSFGFYPFEDWLKRFSGRILGTHLHDSLGFHDHRTPGEGEVDFKRIAAYLPPAAFRTLEIQSHHSVEQVKKGLENLADAGCIHSQRK
jgi:sugar phosphate isomerase/epimerase